MSLESTSRDAARNAVKKSGEVVELLERAFGLVAEDDAVQPTMHHIYAALYEAETRRDVLEDWYVRTYGESAEATKAAGELSRKTRPPNLRTARATTETRTWPKTPSR